MHIFNEMRSSVSKDKGVMLLPYYSQLNPISTYTYIYTHYEKSVVFVHLFFVFFPPNWTPYFIHLTDISWMLHHSMWSIKQFLNIICSNLYILTEWGMHTDQVAYYNLKCPGCNPVQLSLGCPCVSWWFLMQPVQTLQVSDERYAQLQPWTDHAECCGQEVQWRHQRHEGETYFLW